MRISDWSSDVCSSDLADVTVAELARLFSVHAVLLMSRDARHIAAAAPAGITLAPSDLAAAALTLETGEPSGRGVRKVDLADWQFRSEEHTSELQSLMRISYAVFCLKKKNTHTLNTKYHILDGAALFI